MADPQSPAAPAPKVPPELKAKLGELKRLTGEGRFLQALQLMEGLTDEHPESPLAWARAAGVYRGLRMRERAMTMLAKAVLLENPASPLAVQLAKLVAKRAGQQIRDSIGEVMLFVRDLGFRPGGVIDVGVNTGTPGLCEFFPDAHILMIDPLDESIPFMEHVKATFPNAAYERCAAGPRDCEMELSVDPGFGGTRLSEVVGRHKLGQTRTVPVRRVDEMVARHGVPGPYVLKIDTEGAEHEVLQGAAGILPSTELLILETRIRPIGKAPVLDDTLDLLADLGFAAYDFIDRNYHDDDFTLKQFDLVAVRRDGFFRSPKEYARLRTPTPGGYERIIAAKLAKRREAEARLR